MINYSNFDWGWMDEPSNLLHIFPDGSVLPMGEYHKQGMISEMFGDISIYERYFSVKENDIVIDIGASVGPFTFSILDKKPKHVFCLEPSFREFKTLVKNTIGHPVTQIFKGISKENKVITSSMLFGGETEMKSITFKTFLELYGIKQIDFLKTDCEGGEYDIFTDENIEFIKENVKKIVGEWHLNSPESKEKFRHFRDNILIRFDKYHINSIDGVDIKWDLWNEHFIEYYSEVIVYIENN